MRFEIWQLIAGSTLSAGAIGVLLQLLIPKRRDKLDSAKALTDNAIQIAQAAWDAAEQTRNQLHDLKDEIAELKSENRRLQDQVRGFVVAWRQNLPDTPLPVNVESHLVR